jgi:outer membrane protein assembly factor BamB
VDERSGRPVHELRVASAIESSPALAGSLAFVGTDDGDLVALDAEHGSERYRVHVGEMARSSPLPLEDRVVVGVASGRSGGAVAALAAAKGRLLWSRKLASVFSSPALAGEAVLIGSDDGSLHAVDLARGERLWSHELGGKVRGTPAVAGELALVGDFGGRLVAVAVADGSRRWARELGHALYSSPCVAAGLCVVGCREGHVHGLDLATGEPRFEVTTRGPVVSSAVAAGERFLIGSTDGNLYLVAPDGRVLDSCLLARAGIESSPALAVHGSTLFIGSAEGLHAVSLQP